jgi:hypothetical protein
VRRHQRIGETCPLTARDLVPKQADEPFAIHVVTKDAAGVDTVLSHVEGVAWVVDPQWARHLASVPNTVILGKPACVDFAGLAQLWGQTRV